MHNNNSFEFALSALDTVNGASKLKFTRYQWKELKRRSAMR